ncbi:hypothetical protein ACTOJ1_001115 [Shigella flexneri]
MVMACCNLCYRKYLNADGSLNKEGLDEIYGEDKYKILVDEPQNKVIRKNLQKIKLCTCICHTVGMMVMH